MVEDGPDSLYRIGARGSGEGLRALLDSAGINSRTIVPHHNGDLHVIIYDEGRKLRGAVAHVARTLGTQAGESRGTGTMLGSGDQTKSRAEFRDVIRRVEQ